MKNSYTEKQIEIENILHSIIDDPKIIDEIIILAEESKQNVLKDERQEDIESIIKMKLLETTDWRKRAALSALLISNNLK